MHRDSLNYFEPIRFTANRGGVLFLSLSIIIPAGNSTPKMRGLKGGPTKRHNIQGLGEIRGGVDVTLRRTDGEEANHGSGKPQCQRFFLSRVLDISAVHSVGVQGTGRTLRDRFKVGGELYAIRKTPL
jgi:hypothetical protein